MGKFAVIVEKAAQKELIAHYKSGDKSSIKRIDWFTELTIKLSL